MDPFNLNPSQELLLNILPRVAASISLTCSIYMMVVIQRLILCKCRPYHRIMYGCAVNVSILSLLTLWGSLALPKETGQMFAIGNTATCSTQAFLQYWSILITPLYYASLSLLSFFTLRQRLTLRTGSVSGNQETNSNRSSGSSSAVSPPPWLEKLIHVFVNLVPFLMANYLLLRDAYNPGVWRCVVGSIPFGCGDLSAKFYDDYIPCERGPENMSTMLKIFLLAPIVFIGLFPVTILCYLYVTVRKTIGNPLATAVFKQCFVYILLLIMTYLFRFISIGRTIGAGKFNFIFNLLANINENLIGVWMLVAYLFFRVKDSHANGENCTQTENRPTDRMPVRYSYKADFSIFDGGDIPADSPWGAFLTAGVDDDYSESEDVEIFQAARQLSRIDSMEDSYNNETPDVEGGKVRRRSSKASPVDEVAHNRRRSSRSSFNGAGDDGAEFIPTKRRFS